MSTSDGMAEGSDNATRRTMNAAGVPGAVAHTPGPWSYWPEVAGGVVTQDRTASHVCTPTRYPTCLDKTEANARLLASAPDLLAACEAALKYLEANRPKGNIRDNFTQINEHENDACKPLRLAISRARGLA